MIATHKINGQDIYAQFGWLVTKGVETFLAPNVPKDRFSKDWGDENGIEYDLTGQVYLKPRVFNLSGYILADTVEELLFKFQQLTNTLNSSGFLTIYIKSINSTFTAICKSYPTWETATKISNSANKIGFRISVDFDEVTNVELPTYDLFYGSSASIPLTEEAINALASTEYVSNLVLHTGATNRTFSVVIQNEKNILSVEDLDGGLFKDLTSQYINRGTVVIGGYTYKIMSMQIGFPYSTNHRHQIILS